MPAANTNTTRTKPTHNNSNTQIISGDLIQHINTKNEKSQTGQL